VPFIEKAIARKAAGTPLTRPTFAQVRTALAKPAVVAALIVAVAAPIDTARLVGNHQLTNIELGQTGRNPQ
jgi:hypothetical protein